MTLFPSRKGIFRYAREWRLFVPLALLLLLPVLSYTALEYTRLNEQEALVQNLYQAQLRAILFSVNQYCWDVVSGWGNFLHEELQQARSTEEFTRRLAQVQAHYSSVRAAFAYERKQFILAQPESLRAQRVQFTARIAAALAAQSQEIARMEEHAAKGYYRPLAVPFPNAHAANTELLVLFAREDHAARGEYQLAGLLLSIERFMQHVLRPKISEFQDQNFLLAVKRAGDDRVFFATQEAAAASFEYEEPLWVLPEMVLAIKLSGVNTAELVRARTRRTLFLLLGVDAILLLAAVWFLRLLLRETQLARLKSDFVDNVSHDLRTPLGLIRMFAETLQLGRVPSEQKKQEYYGILAREAERLTRMVNNLLDFSRIEAGRKTYELKAIDLGVVLAEVLNSYRYHLQQRGFVLEEKISTPLPAIKADAEAVSQAFVNLLDNAVKYSAAHKHITVALFRAEDWVVVEVTDRGLGIDPKQHRKIFDKFYRVEEIGRDARGAGVGLALVQHVMAAHGAKVEVTSALGKGSSFYLKFPI